SLCTEPTTSAIYTLSLHDALPISAPSGPRHGRGQWLAGGRSRGLDRHPPDANRRAGDGTGTKLVAGRTARALWLVAGGTGATLRALGELGEPAAGAGPGTPRDDPGARAPGRAGSARS